jgi:hypothetical protein
VLSRLAGSIPRSWRVISKSNILIELRQIRPGNGGIVGWSKDMDPNRR